MVVISPLRILALYPPDTQPCTRLASLRASRLSRERGSQDKQRRA